MIIVGTSIVNEGLKVNGMFADGSNVVSIIETSPPNPPVAVDGKENELHLNINTNKLYWIQNDRPLTDNEQLTAIQEQNALMLMALVTGGLM